MPKVAEGKLTPKQAKFVQQIAKGNSASQAAMVAYDVNSYATARSIASENLTKPNVRVAVDNALVLLELTPEKAAQIVKEAMEYEGETLRDTYEMRLKGADRYMKLLTMTEDKQNNSGGNTFVFNQTGKTSKYVDVTDDNEPDAK